MRIGELARRTGVSVRALRYYEEQGLLSADRSPNGYREYDESAVDRVDQIQLLYSAGLCSGIAALYQWQPRATRAIAWPGRQPQGRTPQDPAPDRGDAILPSGARERHRGRQQQVAQR
ncbi:MAG TPA: MerR family DNA-binding transcriptional regulator [Actinopolymorphaceae bacterium]